MQSNHESRPPVPAIPVNCLTPDELYTQSEILQKILDHAPIMINLLDSTGQMKYGNRCWEEWFGWSVEEMHTNDVISMSFPDPAYRAEILEYLARPTRGWREFRPYRRDGHELESSWITLPLSDGSRISIGVDLSRQKPSRGVPTRLIESLVPRSAVWNHSNVSLTKRQREVLQGVAEGRSSKAIAKDLSLSVKTIEAHRAQLMAVLGIHDIAGLVRYAIRIGLVSA